MLKICVGACDVFCSLFYLCDLCVLVWCASAIPNMFRVSLVRGPGTPPVPWRPLLKQPLIPSGQFCFLLKQCLIPSGQFCLLLKQPLIVSGQFCLLPKEPIVPSGQFCLFLKPNHLLFMFVLEKG